MLAAMTLPRLDGETDEAFCRRVMADSGEQARKARERGTEIHAAIQGHYEGKAPSEEMWPFVKGVAAVIEANFPGRTWIAEKPCAHFAGYGTKADLHCPDVVLDFKGSDFDEAGAAVLKTWDEHHMQLAATRWALDLPKAECAICYVSRNTPGLARIIRVDEPSLTQGFEMFGALLEFWKARCGYYPDEWEKAA
jgi:hypothetical protein